MKDKKQKYNYFLIMQTNLSRRGILCAVRYVSTSVKVATEVYALHTETRTRAS